MSRADEKVTIKLISTKVSMKKAVLDYKEEHLSYGEKEISGSAHLDQTESYEEWLEFVQKNRCEETVDQDWVLSDVFFAVDETGQIVGVTDLRYYLNDFLQDYGNCGYSVRPSERGKGYAAEMLRQIIEKAREAGMRKLHMATFQDNYPSVHTILKNGGVWERSFVAEGRMADMYRILL